MARNGTRKLVIGLMYYKHLLNKIAAATAVKSTLQVVYKIGATPC